MGITDVPSNAYKNANVLGNINYGDLPTGMGSQITLNQEVNTYGYSGTPAALPTTGAYSYREIPNINDNDGYLGVTVKYAPRPSSNCGTSGTVAARIANCATTWDGASSGNSGQTTWKLVTSNGANKEVWRDEATGLLWSSVVSTSTNWCQAAGVKDYMNLFYKKSYNNLSTTAMTGNGTISAIIGGALATDETITITFTNATTFTVSGANCGGGAQSGGPLTTTPGSSKTHSRAGYCSFVVTQGSVNFAANDKFELYSIDGATYSCYPGGASGLQPASPVSSCSEGAGLNPPAGEAWIEGGYFATKGGMGKNASTAVYWRLPTKYDYAIAEAHGIRFVMPDMGIAGSARPSRDTSMGYVNSEWSGSLGSVFGGQSWSFFGGDGNLVPDPRFNSYASRRVGR